MKKIRPWAVWRRLFYGSGFLLVLALITGVTYYQFFYQPGNCFDTVMNEGETGVDCGGECVRICAAEVIPPQIIWADSFKIVEGQYNAVAYVENKNPTAGTQALRYRFEFFNGTTKIAERSGTTVLPPNSIYPIFEGRIYTDTQPITNTTLIIEPTELWQPGTIGREQFSVSNLDLVSVDSTPRLRARIENTALTRADKVEVIATLFNEDGKAVTASQTFIESLDARAGKDIVFTWPQPIAKTIKSCSIPSDVVVGIDLSGSMNNDGGTPPQPVTDALTAASSFVSRLAPDDKAAIVTFASSATTASVLTSDHTSTAALIRALTITPAEETGYTNTPAAFDAAAAELASSRHGENARRAFVLVTDGLPTAKGDTVAIVEEAKQAAASLTQSGVEVFVIGLGKNVDQEFVKSLTDNPDNAFYAPSRSELDSIYQNITGALCESGTTRIDVIAKTPTNFTPLR